MGRKTWATVIFLALSALVVPATAASLAGTAQPSPDIVTNFWSIIALGIFVLAYILVMMEEYIHLRKSKPVVVAAGLIWLIFAATAPQFDISHLQVRQMFQHTFLEFAELFIFLLVAMTYINTMVERNVFDTLRAWLVSRGLSLRSIFWLTGAISFFLSPIADNLTTALVMSTCVITVGAGNKRFTLLGCVNVVVAANAGGAFSPFGDITTLMVWQKGILGFTEFFALFVPSVVNYVIPALLMHFFVPKETPKPAEEKVTLKRGAVITMGLFLVTIAYTVTSHHFFHLPPVYGMLTGLGVLQFYSFYLKKRSTGDKTFNVFEKIARAEWDTLLFFYGVLLCVGGLAGFGYLAVASQFLYGDLGPTTANAALGVLSAIVDNIPVMYGVLTMFPSMDSGQWLLITLTTGVGGSLLSIGSAAGVAVMGQSRGLYTFFGHMRYVPIIALGYAASVLTHLWLNAHLFDGVAISLP